VPLCIAGQSVGKDIGESGNAFLEVQANLSWTRTVLYTHNGEARRWPRKQTLQPILHFEEFRRARAGRAKISARRRCRYLLGVSHAGFDPDDACGIEPKLSRNQRADPPITMGQPRPRRGSKPARIYPNRNHVMGAPSFSPARLSSPKSYRFAP
jgi:hypothetical protein